MSVQGRETEAEIGSNGAACRSPRWMATIAILPASLWFLAATVLDPGPAWRARYMSATDPQAAPVVRFERQLSQYWNKQNALAAPGIDARAFSARFDACLALDRARDIPFMLVAQGEARFSVDGQAKLTLPEGASERRTRGEVLRLEAGVHHLEVELTSRGWSSVALLASFDGKAPMPFPKNDEVDGVSLVKPGTQERPCSRP